MESIAHETVYIVRDVEEHYLQGVYRHHLDALDAIDAMVAEQVISYQSLGGYADLSSDPTNEDWDWLRDDYEIIAMPLE